MKVPQNLWKVPIPAMFLLCGSVSASNSDPGTLREDVPVGREKSMAGSPERTALAFPVTLSFPSHLPKLDLPESPARTFFQDFSRNLEEESRRESFLNTRAFLSERWAAEDRLLEEFRARRAETLLNRAFDQYLDDRLDRAFQEVRILRTLSSFLDRTAQMDLVRLITSPKINGENREQKLHSQGGPDGKIQLRLDFHPKVRLEGKWAGFTGNLDLPLVGDRFQLRLQREILPGLTAHLDSTYPARTGSHFTTLALSVIF